MVERHPYKVDVAGSNPVLPTILLAVRGLLLVPLMRFSRFILPLILLLAASHALGNQCRDVIPKNSSSAEIKTDLKTVEERIGSVDVKYFDMRSLRKADGRFSYPESISPKNDVLMLVDPNGHFSLAVNGQEFNGRVINKPIDLSALDEKDHDKQVIIKLKNLTEIEKQNLTSLMEELEGKRSLSCLNAIEFLMDQAIGARSLAARGQDKIHPLFEEFMAKSWVRKDGTIIETEIYKFTEKPMARVVRNIYLLVKILLYGKPVTLPGWVKIALDPESLVRFEPDNLNENFKKAATDEILPIELRTLKPLNKIDKFVEVGRTLWNWIYSTVHNAGGAYQVVGYMTFKKMRHGLIPENHPWVTGVSPFTGRTNYPDNIVFRSPRISKLEREADSDEEIVTKVNTFLAAMTKRSTGEQELPHGPKRRMPHVVNYLHGDVSFNGATLIFDNFKDAMFYLSDRSFVKEIYRFVKEEKREFLIVLREREYDPAEYAVFLGFIRSTLKWYANANGPQQRVLYGTPSPYPVVNVINGNWVNTMKALEKGKLDQLVLPPIPKNKYFTGSYQGNRDKYNLMEAALAYFNYLVLKPRGFQAGFVFTLRKNIEPRQYQQYLEAKARGENPEMIAPVINPFTFIREQGERPPETE